METREYGHPYTPYQIQLDLMQHLYASIDQSQVSIINSPTGTGKSLSLLCSTMTWLNQSKVSIKSALIAQIRQELEEKLVDEPDWVLEQEITRQVKELESADAALEERLVRIREKERQAKRFEGGSMNKRTKLSHVVDQATNKEDEFAPDAYDDQDEAARADAPDNYSAKVREMMKIAEGGSHQMVEEEEPDAQKIYYASRTHSQLSQFVSELRKTGFSGSSVATTSATPPPIRVIPLGSRQTLCINDEVRKRSGGSTEALGDLCLEMQKGGKEKRCQFLPPVNEPAKLNDFRDRALASVHDIEDIEELGRKTGCCPYYGSRKAVRSAQLVTLPYNMLMQKSAREALGISLKDHIVIIDEAHNLISTLLSLHSLTLSITTLESLRKALKTYWDKFKTRLTGLNASYLKQLLIVLSALTRAAAAWEAKESDGGKKGEMMMTVNDLIKRMGGSVDQVNLLKLDEYLTKSKIARKIGGYMDCLAAESTPKGRQVVRSNATRDFHQLQTLLVALANPVKDGRIILSVDKPFATTKSIATHSKGGKQNAASVPATVKAPIITIRYLLLNPSEVFRPVVDEARSVILAGGTMSPLGDFQEQLFPHLLDAQVSTFSCGHIVPKDHIATFALGIGPSGKKLEFTYNTRGDLKILDDLGAALLSICSIIPRGVVAFVSSYAFLDSVKDRWTSTGLLIKLGKKKQVFWETRISADVEITLKDYGLANASTGIGGVLFAVVGARLSEGINFSDDLARAVIICGIPFPNSQSIELSERQKYLRSLPRKEKLLKGQPDAGDVLYQNLAFRAVNQSIGRAIRHANDWASIILIDHRYLSSSSQKKLPEWLGKDIVNVDKSIAKLEEGLKEFCRRRVVK